MEIYKLLFMILLQPRLTIFTPLKWIIENMSGIFSFLCSFFLSVSGWQMMPNIILPTVSLYATGQKVALIHQDMQQCAKTVSEEEND